MEVSQKLKNRTNIWFKNPISEYLSKRIEIVTQRDISTPVFFAYSVHNNQEVKITNMSINRWVDDVSHIWLHII